ncbi:MAG: helix-turn-helix transcriptional regulator [Sphingomonadales bacterium]|jgi:DNA-binding XRE family transcriptional regulator|nr:helix-turn-helix transcriptional regulator [Sphingomonadales bacterium]MBK9004513.1 helix-turn-helix transcriptional regulator [Sphingomonadales bacterium]MBK9269700.1 helix-turn-helix transcriptional regulator [Sphingomonadales bacterium]MBP6433359.1 helix-turn-helix transcriptional regulator [Sphingorhabdus sp.]
MGYEPQKFVAPDGTEMVVMPAADFERLRMLAEESEDVLAAREQMTRLAVGEGTMPGPVLNLMLDTGLSPISAWRKYRGLSQVELAKAAGCTQSALSQIESGARYGTPKLRKALAKALDAPLWTLDNED